MGDVTWIGKYCVRACPEELADGVGWSEHYFIEEHQGGHIDEYIYTGRGTHATRDAAVQACFKLAAVEIRKRNHQVGSANAV